MKFLLTAFVSILSSITVIPQENTSVFFGEVCHVRSQNEHVTKVFLDKNGDYYPDIPISLKHFQKENSLEQWYKLMNSIGWSDPMLENLPRVKSFSEFQDYVLNQAIIKISQNLERDNQKVVVLIHGFRKPYESINGDYSSAEEYRITRERLVNLNPQVKYHFIEIYWDGTYMAPERSLKYAIRLGRLFKKQARKNALSVGLGLRKFLSKLPVDEFDVICHSLGSEVTTNLLFNDGIESTIPTPHQSRINVFFIAPAISKKHFKHYLLRGSEIKSTSIADNYHLNILYNHNDIVLSKHGKVLGLRVEFSRVYGNTRLGCNCKNDAKELKKRFQKKYPNSDIFLFETESIGISHHFRAYVQSPEFGSMMRNSE